MKQIKLTLLNLILIILFPFIAALQCQHNYYEPLKELNSLKEEVEQLQNQLNQQKLVRDNLLKEISTKDSKITSFNMQTNEVRKRCP